LQVSSKIDFNIDDLIKSLGGKDNITNSDATISTLKIEVKNATQIYKESFNDFNVKGFMKNANQIILVFGDNSQAINEELKKHLI
jgi:PTS system D-glucosamine-specific IIC component